MSVSLNTAKHRFSIGFNTFIQVTTASSSDVTAIKTLMNSLRLLCNWAIGNYSKLKTDYFQINRLLLILNVELSIKNNYINKY